MTLFANTFVNNILPALLVMASGYALDKAAGLDLRTLSRVLIYFFIPALSAGSLIQTQVPSGEFGQIVVFGLVLTALLWAAGLATARMLRFDQGRTSAFLLSVLFPNAGNYGLAVTLFAFGEAGLDRALVYFVMNSLLINTLAVYLASRGKFSVRQSIANIFRMPLIYAVVFALGVRALGLSVPSPLMRAIDLTRAGAIPLAQFLLGAQLARISRQIDLRFVGVATLFRLVIGAAAALGLSLAMGLTGVTRSASVAQSSMPTAVSVVALAIEFGSDPQEVGGVVLVSTLASAFTLTALIALLMAG